MEIVTLLIDPQYVCLHKGAGVLDLHAKAGLKHLTAFAFSFDCEAAAKISQDPLCWSILLPGSLALTRLDVVVPGVQPGLNIHGDSPSLCSTLQRARTIARGDFHTCWSGCQLR